jgi:hypothetical protein
MENIEIYYESIKQVLDEIVKWQDRKKPAWRRLLAALTNVIFARARS